MARSTNPINPLQRTQRTARPAPEGATEFSIGDFIKIASLTLGIYLFFCGWIYLYTYLAGFGVSINDLDLPIWSFYVYGFEVLISFAGFAVLSVNLVIILTLRALRKAYPQPYYIGSIVILVFSFAEIHYITQELAGTLVKKIKANEEHLPLVYVHFNAEFVNSLQRPNSKSPLWKQNPETIPLAFENDREIGIDLLKENFEEKLLFLLESNDEYVVLKRVVRNNENSFQVFRINKLTVNFIKIMPVK